MAFPDSACNTIVLGVDGRQGGREALRLARQLAEAGGGDLVAVHVFPYQHRPALAGSPAVAEERESAQVALDSAPASLMGSVSSKVVHRAECDVLVVR